MSLSIYYQNVRGLRTKLQELRLNLPNCDEDIICMTETNLNDFILDGEVASAGYKIFRRDRKYFDSTKGCMVLCKQFISCIECWISKRIWARLRTCGCALM